VPRSYSPESRRKVLDLLKAGRIVAQIVNDLQISDPTIYTWRWQEAIDTARLPGITLPIMSSCPRLDVGLRSWRPNSRSTTMPPTCSRRWCPKTPLRGHAHDGR
jgi:hypothetical protein